MLGHSSEVFDEKYKTQSAHQQANDAQPDEAVLVFREVDFIRANVPVHLHGDLDRSAVHKVVPLQELPRVAIIAHLDIVWVDHLEFPSNGEVPNVPQRDFDLRVIIFKETQIVRIYACQILRPVELA